MFFDAVKERNIPLDFYSFHGYIFYPKKVLEYSDLAKEAFISRGLPVPELIYNEWNYVRGWEGDDWVYSLKSEKNIKGAEALGIHTYLFDGDAEKLTEYLKSI